MSDAHRTTLIASSFHGGGGGSDGTGQRISPSSTWLQPRQHASSEPLFPVTIKSTSEMEPSAPDVGRLRCSTGTLVYTLYLGSGREGLTGIVWTKKAAVPWG